MALSAPIALIPLLPILLTLVTLGFADLFGQTMSAQPPHRLTDQPATSPPTAV